MFRLITFDVKETNKQIGRLVTCSLILNYFFFIFKKRILNSFDLYVLERPPKKLQSLIFYDMSITCMPHGVHIVSKFLLGALPLFATK
jgi:hypothetical protein